MVSIGGALGDWDSIAHQIIHNLLFLLIFIISLAMRPLDIPSAAHLIQKAKPRPDPLVPGSVDRWAWAGQINGSERNRLRYLLVPIVFMTSSYLLTRFGKTS